MFMMEISSKLVLLNPSNQFKQTISGARSIVLAGDTMQTLGELIVLLFGSLGINEDCLTLYSCDHKINKNRLYIATLVHGIIDKLAFNDEMGLPIQKIAILASASMVCLFRPYGYEQLCYNLVL